MLTERLSVSVDSSSLSAWDVALCKELIVLDWSLTQDQRPQMSSCSNGHKHSQADLRVDLNWINRSIQLYLFVLILEKGNEMKFANVLLWEPLGRNESLRAPCRKRFVLAALHFHCQENMFALYCAVLAQRLSFLIAWYLRFFIIPTSLSLSLSLSPHYILLYCWWCLGGRHPPRWPPSLSLPFPSHEKRFQLSDWILFLPDLHCSVRAPSIFWLTRRLFIRPKPGKASVPLSPVPSLSSTGIQSNSLAVLFLNTRKRLLFEKTLILLAWSFFFEFLCTCVWSTCCFLCFALQRPKCGEMPKTIFF